MLKGKKIYVIIGAAGSGSRMGGPLPKQFLKIGGTTILEKTVGTVHRGRCISLLGEGWYCTETFLQ